MSIRSTTKVAPQGSRSAWRAVMAALAVCICAAITACGGGGSGDDSATAPPQVSATLGASGGSITGPDGVRLDVPAGALDQAVTITIARDDRGAPSRPAAITDPIYAITPHGLQFKQPVTLTLPKAAQGQTDEMLNVMRGQPGGTSWETLPAARNDDGSVSVALSGLSYYHTYGGGFAVSLDWIAPAPGVATNAFANAPRQITTDTQVHVRLTARVYSWCGNTFQGALLIYPDPVPIYSQPLRQLVQTASVSGQVDLTMDFAIDVAVASKPDAITIVAAGSCPQLMPHSSTQASNLLKQTSVVLKLKPIALPTITQQPVGAVTPAGSPVTLAIAATAPDTLRINWQRSSDNGVTWTDLDSHAAQLNVVLGSNDTSTSFKAQVCNVNANGQACLDSNVVVVSVPVAGVVPWQSDSLIAGSGTHSMAITNSGTLWTWGANNGGALGRASTLQTPQPVTTLTQVRSVAAGAWYSVALRSNGDVYAWGWGENVGTAIGSTTLDNPLPVRVAGLSGIRSIATRYTHVLALDGNGAVWGFGPEASLALGPTIGNDGVRRIGGLPTIRQIAAGQSHSVALADDGSVWSWGSNSSGQLGTLDAAHATPARVPGLSDIVAIAAAGQATLALGRDGTVWSCGDASVLGRDSTGRGMARIPTLAGVTALGAGFSAAWARLADGSWMGWGVTENGGNISGSVVAAYPVAIPALQGSTQVSGGENHALALRADGVVLSWGSNVNFVLAGTPGSTQLVPGPSGFDRSLP